MAPPSLHSRDSRASGMNNGVSVFSVKTIPEAKAKHYAGETPGGKPDAIKGDQKELSLVASGVELERPGR